MTALLAMTKKQLLELAKEHEIVGRHDMTKEALAEALEEFQEDEDDEDLPRDDDACAHNDEINLAFDEDGEEIEVAEVASKETLLHMKRRHPSQRVRGENGLVLRAGSNLSGNVPFRRKYYYLQPAFAFEKTWTAEYKEALAAAPNQVKLILRWMRQAQITSPTDALLGREIVAGAKAAGVMVSKISDEALAAYYRRLLEALGMAESDEMEE